MKENVVPVFIELAADTLTPVLAFMRLSRHSEQAFFLESVEGGEKIARYSFLGIDPFECLTIIDGRLIVETAAGKTEYSGSPFATLEKHLGRYRARTVEGFPPFCGGAVGYVGFDCVRYLEDIHPPKHPQGFPEAVFMLFKNVVAYDRVKDRIIIVVNIFTDQEDLEEGKLRAGKEARKLAQILFEPNANDSLVFNVSHLEPEDSELSFEESLNEEAYKKAVRSVKKHIRAGDIFQCVISDQFKVPVRAHPFSIYRSLRALNPSPYLFYLKMPNQILLGASPEMLVRVANGIVETRPIAGTRPRGADPKTDRKLEKELLASTKECAEHLMLVDLGRNDIGRVAVPGTVQVDEFMQVQRFSNVMHLVSEVKGKLKKSVSPWEAFCACFPAGTLSGAPKIRAMEIITALEPVGRGPYGGAVVYYDFSGKLDSCINIRSLMVQGNVGYIQAGAGIVADSNPQKEYEEVRHKSAALFRAIETAHAVRFLRPGNT